VRTGSGNDSFVKKRVRTVLTIIVLPLSVMLQGALDQPGAGIARAKAYAELKHPLADRAQRDLEWFRQHQLPGR
jgi:hypothetical protein